MPRADSGYHHNFMVNSWVFKGGDSESVVKTNSGAPVCPLLVDGLHFACVEYAQGPLLAHCVRTHTHTHKNQGRTRIFLHTLLLRADHQYLNSQHLACEVLTRVYVILTRCELLFVYKMIR